MHRFWATLLDPHPDNPCVEDMIRIYITLLDSTIPQLVLNSQTWNACEKSGGMDLQTSSAIFWDSTRLEEHQILIELCCCNSYRSRCAPAV